MSLSCHRDESKILSSSRKTRRPLRLVVETMSRFSDTLMDHFQAPRNEGRLDSADAIGVAGVPGQGRYIVIYLRIVQGHVASARFQCHGCGVTIACGSALTELIEGRTCQECWALTPDDLTKALDGLPPDKGDRAGFAIHALREALRQLGPSPIPVSA